MKRLDKKRIFAVWREVSHWVAGHKRPTHVNFDTLGIFKFKIQNTPEGTNAYQKYWKQALQASAKAGKAEVALRGYQRIQKVNLKEALRMYLDQVVQQEAVMSIDWWDKLKQLKIITKGKSPAIFQTNPRTN